MTASVQTGAGRHARTDAAVDLYWLPLGAGGRSVRVNGLIFEGVAARVQHRSRCDLYHSALEVRLGGARYVIEMAPVWNERADDRGVVVEGPVGSRRLDALRLFRYEIRCWRDGRIPDIAEAVDSPQRLSEDASVARRVLDVVPAVPALVWGRDQLHIGEMWNSNSVTAWLLTEARIDARGIHPPDGGRAPGWVAGLADPTAGARLSAHHVARRRRGHRADNPAWTGWRRPASARAATRSSGLHRAADWRARPYRRSAG